MKRYIGIDPGSTGAIAMIPEDGDIEIYELTEDNLLNLCRDWCMDDCIVCLEQVASMPGQGVRSVWTFAEGFGFIKGALRSYFIPFQTIKPQKWKKEFGIVLGRNATKTEKKEADIAVCKRLFPNVSLLRTPKCRTDSDGFADALLMAEYARRKL